MQPAFADEPIRIVIADDHELVRYGLRSVFEAEGDISIVGEAADGHAAVDVALATSPDVVLLDIRMPGIDGVEVCRAIKDRRPGTRVLILTSFDEHYEVAGALSVGASGYVMKDIAPDELVQTVRGIAQGRTILDPAVAKRVFKDKFDAAEESRNDTLSKREHEVLRLMADGLSNKEIARELWVSEPTVKTHVSHVIQKLGQRDRTQAVLAAIRLGLVEVGSDRDARV